MPAPPADVVIPKSYKNVGFKHTKISHYPEDAPEATPIVIFTLYRPGKHNAFTETMMDEVEQAFQWFDLDDRVKCVITTGDGRIFCAGADLETSFKGGYEKPSDHRDGGGRCSLAIHRCRKPTIAAMQGSAVGVGVTMTLPMTIRIAYSQAKIGFVFARRGLIMEACSAFFLPRLIGMSRALHVVTTGATYRADDKIFGDLFSETLDAPEKVLPRALEIADDIVKNTSVVSTHLMRELMYRNPGSAEGTHLLDSRLIFELFSTPDNKEGVASFLEKRPVNFKGSLEHDAPDAYPWWETPEVVRGPKAAGYAYRPKSRI